MFTKNRLNGFTLIEMMITVAILGILLAVAIPSYQNYVRAGKVNTAKADLMALSMALENHKLIHLAYPAAATVTADTAATKAKLTNSSWSPAQGEFAYTYKRESATRYTIKATGSDQLSQCVLTLDSANPSPIAQSSQCDS